MIYFGIVLALLLIFFVITSGYKKEIRKGFDKKEHKFLILYGMAMFIVDHLPDGILRNDKKTAKAIRELKVKGNTQRELYLYYVEKTSLSLLIFIVMMFFGMLSAYKYGSLDTGITSLARDDDVDTSYEFNVIEDETEEKVEINVKARQLTEDEVNEKIYTAEEQLLSLILDEDDSPEKVEHNLDLVSAVDDVQIKWSIDDTSVIAQDGTIQDGISDEGTVVTISAEMTYEDTEITYEFTLNVYPSAEPVDVEQSLQEYVDSSSLYDEEIELPENIDGSEVSYTSNDKDYSIFIIPVSLILSVALFVLKDRDLKEKQDDRKKQLSKDYPEIVSKLLLYFKAGLSIKSSVGRIVKEYRQGKSAGSNERFAYEELELSYAEMNSGMSEIAAMNNYANRCGLHSYIRLASILEQNLRRGSKDVSAALKAEMDMSMAEKRNLALKEGGEISTKLLGPMMLFLLVTMAVVMVPAFMSMNV